VTDAASGFGRVARAVEDGPFVTVARLEDVPPGTVTTVAACDRRLALAHCDGAVHAVQADCLHLEGPLGEGRLEGCVLTCPWHGWQYDVRTGENEFDRAIRLETYEVRIEDGHVQVRV
jgi:nitrite reductase/ring-hydroxylating ferredoxin subunit